MWQNRSITNSVKYAYEEHLKDKFHTLNEEAMVKISPDNMDHFHWSKKSQKSSSAVSREGEDGAQFNYEMQKRRRVATIPFGGDPQDEYVGEVRKKLYEAVTQDGFVPKLDEMEGLCSF